MIKKVSFLVMLFAALSLTMVACKTNGDDSSSSSSKHSFLDNTSWISESPVKIDATTTEYIRIEFLEVSDKNKIDIYLVDPTSLMGYGLNAGGGVYTLNGSTVIATEVSLLGYGPYTLTFTISNDSFTIDGDDVELPGTSITFKKQN